MLRRIAPAAVATTLLLGGLTACSTQQTAAEGCDAFVQAGALSDSVTVLGAFGEQPQVQIPEDVQISVTQRTILTADETEGSSKASDRGTVAGEGTLVGVNMTFYDASTGKGLYESPAAEYLIVSEATPNPLSEGVRCAATGERLALALAPADALPLTQQIGGTPGEAMVGIIDIVSVSEFSTQGRVRALPAGFPAVVTNEEGRPGVVLPPNEAPSGTSAAVRIQGEGTAVGAEDNVIAQVLEVGWDGRLGMNTWAQGNVEQLFGESQIPMTGLTFREALTGQKVGSQVVVIENVPEGARVLVVDILDAG